MLALADAAHGFGGFEMVAFVSAGARARAPKFGFMAAKKCQVLGMART